MVTDIGSTLDLWLFTWTSALQGKVQGSLDSMHCLRAFYALYCLSICHGGGLMRWRPPIFAQWFSSTETLCKQFVIWITTWIHIWHKIILAWCYIIYICNILTLFQCSDCCSVLGDTAFTVLDEEGIVTHETCWIGLNPTMWLACKILLITKNLSEIYSI